LLRFPLARKVQAFLAKKSIQLVPRPLYSPDLTPANLSLSPMLEEETAGLTLSRDKFKTKWEGIIRTLSQDEFIMLFQKWLECC
jgi:hypothetical protein